jgi:hypothetical protein
MDGEPCIEVEVDECSEIISGAYRIAKKEHKCCECHEKIEPKERYYYECTKSPDGDLLCYKTCVICKELRDKLCYGWTWGGLWEDIYNFIEQDPSRSVLDCAIGKLSKPALDAYLDEVKRLS